MPITINEEQLTKIFSPYGTISELKLMKDKASGLNTGQAFVRYDIVDAAANAVQAMNNYIFPGTIKGINVRFADTPEEKLKRKEKQARLAQKYASNQNRYNPYAYAPSAMGYPGQSNPGFYGYPQSVPPMNPMMSSGPMNNRMQSMGNDSSPLSIYCCCCRLALRMFKPSDSP